MSDSVLALLGFAGWTVLLVLTTITLRSWIFLVKRRESAEFRPDGSDVSPFHMRLCRAHANCVENLPIFGAIVLTAIATGHSEVTDAMALWVLLARVAQSLTHLLSTSNLAITVRVTFYSIQLAVEVYWIIQLAKIALGGQ